MKLSDFDFDLPNALIAQYPSEKRTDARLLVVQDDFINATFFQLTNFLKPKDLLILNDTKVIPARLFGRKESGGKVEILVERLINEFQALAMIKASRAPKISSYIVLENDKQVKVIDKASGLYKLSFDSSILTLLNEIGHVPLPPYIERIDGKEDLVRYQTIYAKNDGAVAAPTAGLHFDELLLSKLNSDGIDHAFVTLHVGAGTFQPVKVEDIKDHQMHSEYFEVCQETVDKIVSTKANGGRIVAVGTTAVRTLESIALQGKLSAQKGIRIYLFIPDLNFVW